MSPMSRPEMFPGSLSLIAALDGGASLAEAEVQSVSSRTSVFGRRKSFALGKDLARVEDLRRARVRLRKARKAYKDQA